MTPVRIDPDFARRRTAEIMARSQREIPTFHVSKQARADGVHARAQHAGVSITIALLPVVAQWLGRHPLLNAHWSEDGLAVRSTVDLGVAWSHRENVLVVPTLRDCATWEVSHFARALVKLRGRSHFDAFESADFRTPTFTVSNLGVTGIDSFTSLVTPPQVAVLSMAALGSRPVAVDDSLSLAQTLPLTLGVDHRAVDGMYAGRALADLAGHIEEGRLE